MSDLTVIDASPAERVSIEQFQEAMGQRSQPVRFGSLRSPDGQDISVPEPLFRVLCEAAKNLVAGYQVIIAPFQHQLTTQEAADFLNVSRTYVCRMVDEGQIPSEKIGRHRRIQFGELMEYKKRRMAQKKESLINLIRETEELGLYGKAGKKQ